MGYKNAKEREVSDTLRGVVRSLGASSSFEDVQRFMNKYHPEIKFTRSQVGQLRRQLGFPRFKNEMVGPHARKDTLGGKNEKSLFPKGKPVENLKEIEEIPLYGDTDGHPEVKPRPHAALRAEAMEGSIQPSAVSVPVSMKEFDVATINGHPMESLQDLAKFVKRFGGVQGVRGALNVLETIATAMKE